MNYRINITEATAHATQAGLKVTHAKDGSVMVGAVRVYHTGGGKACWTFDGWTWEAFGQMRQHHAYLGQTIKAAADAQMTTV